MTAGASKTAVDPPQRASIRSSLALRTPPVGLRPPYAVRSARERVTLTVRDPYRGSLLRADKRSRLDAD